MTLITYPFHYLYFENFYSQEELDLIWEELNSLYVEGDKFLSPDDTHSAKDDNGNYIKANRGLWLEDKSSNLFNITKKLYDPTIINHPSSWFFKDTNFNKDVTLISYYDDDDYYAKHNDSSYITACTWLYKEPKQFLGGEFWFPDYDIKVPCKNNSCIIFPSNIWHSVKKVYLPDEYKNKGYGRYCISQFVSVNIGKDVSQ
jgi:Rps23 Pro-64 3,4-dihydroxylase Tpa1-like proline 4-hydroxylase